MALDQQRAARARRHDGRSARAGPRSRRTGCPRPGRRRAGSGRPRPARRSKPRRSSSRRTIRCTPASLPSVLSIGDELAERRERRRQPLPRRPDRPRTSRFGSKVVPLSRETTPRRGGGSSPAANSYAAQVTADLVDRRRPQRPADGARAPPRTSRAPFARHWLPPLRAGGVRLQVCADLHRGRAAARDGAASRPLGAGRGVPPRAAREPRRHAADHARGRRARRSPTTRASALLLSIEGVEPWEADDDLADDFWELGVRMAGLTWNFRNVFADGVAEPAQGGLSARGARLVERLLRARDDPRPRARLRADVPRRARACRAASPGARRAMPPAARCYDSPRNVSDAQMEAIAAAAACSG